MTLRILLIHIILSCLQLKLNAQGAYPFRDGDKWFIVDSTFNRISKKTYSFITPLSETRFIVTADHKIFGVISEKNEIIIPLKYERIDTYDGGEYNCVKAGKHYNFDYKGKVIHPPVIGYCGGSIGRISAFLPYEKNGKTGMYRYTFNNNAWKCDTIPADYEQFYEFTTNRAFARLKNKWGMINEKNEIITAFMFDSVNVNNHCYDTNELCISIYTIGNLKGYVDSKGVLLTGAKYYSAQFYAHGYAMVQDSSRRWGYIDLQGREYFR